VCCLFTASSSSPYRLAEEGTTNQKLQHEKIAAEGKIKTLEEQLTVSEDSIIKVR